MFSVVVRLFLKRILRQFSDGQFLWLRDNNTYDVISSMWSGGVFSTSFTNNLFMCYFSCLAQKITISRGFNLISDSW